METGKTNTDLLRILAECAAECEACFDASLENERTDALARVIRMCRDCAKICYTTSSFIASNSNHAGHLAKECAEICKECADACGSRIEKEEKCRTCMKICRECAEACKTYAA